MKNCTLYFKLGEDTLEVAGMDKKCRYHKCRQEYSSSDISPDGLCAAAFAALYPHCLSMLSRGKYPVVNNKEICRVKCPGRPGNVEFNLFRKPYLRTGLKKWFFYFKKAVDFFLPLEVIANKAFIEVVADSGNCPFNYKQGEVFEFNVGDKREICPAGFYALYPFYLSTLDKSIARTAGLPENRCVISCSDYNTNIQFQFGESGGDARQYYFAACDDYGDIVIKIQSVRNCTHSCFTEGMEIGVNELIRKMEIPCYAVLYNAYPYMLTLENGGSLGFLTTDRNAAGIQCPNSGVHVKMFVKRDRHSGNYSINVFGSRGRCPKELERGRQCTLPDFSNRHFDITALSMLFPYIMHMKYLVNSGSDPHKTLSCSYHKGEATVEFLICRNLTRHKK